MNKIFKVITRICFLGVFFSVHIYAQPRPPFNPETADGASNIGGYNTSSFQLKWVNPSGVIYNELYCSYDSAKVANLDTTVRLNGYPSTVYSDYSIYYYHCMRYYWRIVEYNSTGRTLGPVWRFYTKANYDGDLYFIIDDFFNGIGLWNINGNQNCKWKLDSSSSYTLPAPSSGNVLSVKNSQSGITDSSVAYFKEIIVPSYAYPYGIASVQFDSDLKLDNSSDAAFLEYSTDQGLNWITSWSKNGVSDRNDHIQQLLYEFPVTIPDSISMRLRIILVDNTSWWAIDNFNIEFETGYLTIPYVSDLHVSITTVNKVQINFSSYVGSHYLFRKNGLPLSPNNYAFIASVSDGSKSFVDTTVLDSSVYTYKVTNNWTTLPFYTTNEATAYINYIDTIMPVELTSFSYLQIDKGIKLLWTTATEINNSGFYIERSYSNKDWMQVGFVKGSGTSNVTHNYTFTDNLISDSKILYCLKQLDNNGAVNYSNVIETNEVINGFQLSQNYPNPFNPSTTIKYSLSKAGNVKLTVYNAIGSKIATIVNEYKVAGNYSVQFNGSNLASGIYLYRMESGNYSAVKKFILLK